MKLEHALFSLCHEGLISVNDTCQPFFLISFNLIIFIIIGTIKKIKVITEAKVDKASVFFNTDNNDKM